MEDQITIRHEDDWRASYWADGLPGRQAWFVSCADHPKLGLSHGEPWGYATNARALSVVTRHGRSVHRGHYRVVRL